MWGLLMNTPGITSTRTLISSCMGLRVLSSGRLQVLARLVRFTLAPGSETKAQELDGDLTPSFSAEPGYLAVTI